MEVGGNQKVNAIFEATSIEEGAKPDPSSDQRTREHFVRAKYVDRKYYDAKGYADINKVEKKVDEEDFPPSSSTHRRRSMTCRQSSKPGISWSQTTTQSKQLDNNRMDRMNASETWDANRKATQSKHLDNKRMVDRMNASETWEANWEATQSKQLDNNRLMDRMNASESWDANWEAFPKKNLGPPSVSRHPESSRQKSKAISSTPSMNSSRTPTTFSRDILSTPASTPSSTTRSMRRRSTKSIPRKSQNLEEIGDRLTQGFEGCQHISIKEDDAPEGETTPTKLERRHSSDSLFRYPSENKPQDKSTSRLATRRGGRRMSRGRSTLKGKNDLELAKSVADLEFEDNGGEESKDDADNPEHARLGLIMKLKECLETDNKNSEEKLRELMMTLEKAESVKNTRDGSKTPPGETQRSRAPSRNVRRSFSDHQSSNSSDSHRRPPPRRHKSELAIGTARRTRSQSNRRRKIKSDGSAPVDRIEDLVAADSGLEQQTRAPQRSRSLVNKAAKRADGSRTADAALQSKEQATMSRASPQCAGKPSVNVAILISPHSDEEKPSILTNGAEFELLHVLALSR
jgi:hypothetical protein